MISREMRRLLRDLSVIVQEGGFLSSYRSRHCLCFLRQALLHPGDVQVEAPSTSSPRSGERRNGNGTHTWPQRR